MDNKMTCPVCNEVNEVGKDFCDKCRWEFRYFATTLSESEKQKENKRLEIARDIWSKINMVSAPAQKPKPAPKPKPKEEFKYILSEDVEWYKDQFTTEKEYKEKINKLPWIKVGTIKFNKEDYNIKNSKFNIEIGWNTTISSIIYKGDSLAYININRDNAKEISQPYNIHNVYCKLVFNKKISVKKYMIRFNETEYLIKFKPKPKPKPKEKISINSYKPKKNKTNIIKKITTKIKEKKQKKSKSSFDYYQPKKNKTNFIKKMINKIKEKTKRNRSSYYYSYNRKKKIKAFIKYFVLIMILITIGGLSIKYWSNINKTFKTQIVERIKNENEGLIKDKNLDEAIRNNIKKYDGVLTIEDLTSITSLEASGYNIKKLEGIEKLSNLEELNLSNNKIKKIEQIKQINNLKILNLNSNKIKETTDLSALRDLTELDLGSNKIKDISSLSTLENLKILNLNHNKIRNISFLSDLNQIEYLDLGHNKIYEIPNIQLNSMKSLMINNNRLREIGNLKKFSTLKNLNLNNNYLKHNKVLLEMKALENVEYNMNLRNDIGNESTSFKFSKEYSYFYKFTHDWFFLLIICVAIFMGIGSLFGDNGDFSDAEGCFTIIVIIGLAFFVFTRTPFYLKTF